VVFIESELLKKISYFLIFSNFIEKELKRNLLLFYFFSSLLKEWGLHQTDKKVGG